MKIRAQYTGAQYTFISYDFSVNVIDPCLNDATITPNAQTNPAAYSYTAFSPAATFTLNPFTIFPTFCVETFSCLTLVGTEICSVPGVSTFDTTTGAY